MFKHLVLIINVLKDASVVIDRLNVTVVVDAQELLWCCLPGVDCHGLLDDQTVLDQLPHVGPGVGVGDLVDLIGVQPHLPAMDIVNMLHLQHLYRELNFTFFFPHFMTSAASLFWSLSELMVTAHFYLCKCGNGMTTRRLVMMDTSWIFTYFHTSCTMVYILLRGIGISTLRNLPKRLW